MKMIRVFGRDLKLGTIKKFYNYVLLFVIAGMICQGTYTVYIKHFSDNMIAGNGTWFDYLMSVNPGMKVFSIVEDKEFNVPIYWFTMQIMMHYMIAYYPENDFRLYGKTIIPKIGSAGKWWISKCLWCILSVLISYGLIIVSTLLFANIHNAKIKPEVTNRFLSQLHGAAVDYLSSGDIILIVIIVPMMTTISLCLLELLLSFIISPVISYIMICAMYVLSAYYHTWWLTPGFTMWKRSSYVNFQKGYTPKTGILIAVYLSMACIIGGKLYFDRKDVL